MPPSRPRQFNRRTAFCARGGQLWILDFAENTTLRKAHELYGDRWLGFAESDLHHWLEAAGLKKIEISVVAREEQPPHFQTIPRRWREIAIAAGQAEDSFPSLLFSAAHRGPSPGGAGTRRRFRGCPIQRYGRAIQPSSCLILVASMA